MRNASNADVAPIPAFPRKQGKELLISSLESRAQFSFVVRFAGEGGDRGAGDGNGRPAYARVIK